MKLCTLSPLHTSFIVNDLSFQLRRLQSTLVVAEHNNEVLSAATQNTLSAAKKIGGDLTVLVAGTKCGPVSISHGISQSYPYRICT